MRTSSRDRAPHAAPRAVPPEAGSETTGQAYDDAYLDGLFTYCLSIMGEHDAATAALGEALALAERQDERGRRPTTPALLRPWLYALARWSCLRRLAAQRRTPGDTSPDTPRALGEGAEARRRRRELAALSWPEAAGTTQPQREALELTIRHQLPVAELARVLRLSESAAHTLVTSGAREVERTRAALAALESAGCPATAALAGDDRRLLLGSGMRRELIRHVDECPSCRLVARRAMAATSWPGGAPAEETRLTVLPAPRPAVEAARLAIRRARAQHTPRYDRAGFPLDERDRAARREKLRSRAFATTVVAAVVAAPVLALWAAYRGAPPATETARSEDTAATAQDNALTGPGPGGGELRFGGVSGAGAQERDTAGAEERTGDGDAADAQDGADPSASPGTGDDRATAGGDGASEGGDAGPGRITAEAVPTGEGTRVTLTASGGEPVTWTLTSDADWLVPSATSGTLEPGESQVVEVTVDPGREPAGPWQGRITVEPAAAVITVEGGGAPEPGPSPSEPPPAEPEEPAEPTPTGEPSQDSGAV
ncbi:BACON domain-containing protein [Streptomyces avicenniae]|uniref:BACON domain-containing protein n=1 Tax=Streptomyces avicenniae TaxID=500153 RepID=UPI00069AF3FE|nr:sigma-70 family RNA polymerase sigma factor [Streptomyces avicenniae]